MTTPRLHYLKIWKGLGWALVLSVIVLSLAPTPDVPVTFDMSDKLIHLAAYCVLMFWFGAIHLSTPARLKTGAALVFMGVLLEFAQGWTGYRSFQVPDMAANSLGVVLGFFLCRTSLSGVFSYIEKKIAAA